MPRTRSFLCCLTGLLLLTNLACDPGPGSSVPGIGGSSSPNDILGTSPFAAAVSSDLFISEYVEGSSNNKAIELFNGTAAEVDLASYRLEFYFNGSSTPGTTIPLVGTVAPGETFVVADNDASSTILAPADQTSTASFFNGDDAIALVHGDVSIDIFGQIGFDPGAEWPSPDGGTQNNTLRRRAGIIAGDMDGTDAFDPSLEWEGFGEDNFSDLGQHGGASGDTGTESGGGSSATGELDAPWVSIHEIQGPGAASPREGDRVTIEAVVTATAQGSDQLSGFFVQEEDANADADPQTSEGLFVFAASPSVAVGDRVQVEGTVVEYFGLTELSEVTRIVIVGAGELPTPIAVALPWSSLDELEALEGMRVAVDAPLVVTDNYDLGRYGVVTLSSQRLSQPTQVASPGPAALAIQAANALDQILLDDLSNDQNPDPVVYPPPALSLATSLRTGDIVTALEGVLDFSFGEYKIRPTAPPSFESANPRPAPLARAGDLRIGAFNVLNFFNGDGLGGGFPTSRGADSAEEFERQSAKLVDAILGMDADIIGVLEIENDGYGPQSAIADLVGRLNAAAAPGSTYAFVDPGVSALGTDEIAVGFIYRATAAIPFGPTAVLDESVDPRFLDDLNRPSLTQTFEADDERVTVTVSHFKSKGSGCDDVGDPDAGDGQGNCNGTRTQAALALRDWMDSDPTGSDDPDQIAIGDFNAYAMEDPITALTSGGYINLAPDGHSYSFDGQWGTLDYALGSASVAAQTVSATYWNINADEPRVFDYNLEFKSEGQIDDWYAPDAYRASDHDPVIVDLAWGTGEVNVPPTVNLLLPPSGRVPPIVLVLARAQDEDDPVNALDVAFRLNAGAWIAGQPIGGGLFGALLFVPRGSHSLSAQATDPHGATSVIASRTLSR